jgi:hypothetical protein
MKKVKRKEAASAFTVPAQTSSAVKASTQRTEQAGARSQGEARPSDIITCLITSDDKSAIHHINSSS